MNIANGARAMGIVLVIAGLHCERGKTNPTKALEPVTKHDDGATAFVGPIDAATSLAASEPTATNDAGPAEWYACRKAEECTVVPEGRCCTSCDPVAFRGYTAVNSRHKSDFLAREGCSTAKCPPCPAPPANVPRSDSNFFAICRNGRCLAVDLRDSTYSECKSHKDCALRHGLGCCEGCGDKDLVAFNPASSLNADLCPIQRKCSPLTPACLANRSPSRAAECVISHCKLTDD